MTQRGHGTAQSLERDLPSGNGPLLPRAIVYRWKAVANCGICLLWKTSGLQS